MVDFIGLPNFPVFNVADIAITCSAVAMIILAWRGIPLAESAPDGSSSEDERVLDDDKPAAGSGP